jgi:hypothetical protein
MHGNKCRKRGKNGNVFAMKSVSFEDSADNQELLLWGILITQNALEA